MKERKGKSFILIIVAIVFLQVPINVYAAVEPLIERPAQIVGAKQFKSQGTARVIGSPRGRLISSAEIALTDKGGGTIEVYADLLCHEPMGKLRVWLYLEKWIPEEEVWETIEYEQFSWVAEDFPDQDLTMAMITYEITKLERGQDYRVRGMFGADALNSLLKESWTVITPNLFLE